MIKKKIKLANTTWEIVRLKTKTKKQLRQLKIDWNMLTFDEVVNYLLKLNKNY